MRMVYNALLLILLVGSVPGCSPVGGSSSSSSSGLPPATTTANSNDLQSELDDLRQQLEEAKQKAEELESEIDDAKARADELEIEIARFGSEDWQDVVPAVRNAASEVNSVLMSVDASDLTSTLDQIEVPESE